MNWMLIEDSAASGSRNMAKDDYCFRRVTDWKRPVLRLYEWERPTLSLGRNQRDQAIDLEACARQGIPLVRRMTGGWAVLHGADLTYAVIAPLQTGRFGDTILTSYRAIAEVFLQLFRVLGYAPGLQSYSNRERIGMASPICFAMPSACELLIEGKKLIGSAQRRRPEAFLQHGSIPMARQHSLLASLFTGATPEGVAAAMTDLESIGLWERLPRAEFRARLLDSFERVMGARFEAPPWGEEDEAAVRQLEADYAPLAPQALPAAAPGLLAQ
jgi:lipoate-protein ligase A